MTLALPPALRPWASELRLFPEEVALGLGPHVARLAAALGALRPRSEVSGGEPVGYDGLARRGTYERLLLTEWLYAEEAPEEFLRRAAHGEHSFLRPAFRQPQGGRRSLALLDVGPEQLGAPRVAQLALLVVLARRAEAAGAAFHWCVLQAHPQWGPYKGLSEAGLQSWLAARSASGISGERLGAWREALGLGGASEDVWLVGSSRLGRLAEASGLSRVELEEEVAPGARRLTVRVCPVARASREVALELPREEDCVRLLRDPFSRRTVAPVRGPRGGPVQALRLSAEGTRLLLLHRDGGVTAQALPHSPRATVARPRSFPLPEGHQLVAVGWRRTGGLLALTESEGVLWVHGTLQAPRARGQACFPRARYEGRLPQVPPPGGAPGQMLSVIEEGVERLLVRDAAGGVFALSHPSGATGLPAVALAQKATVLLRGRRGPVWVCAGEEGEGEGHSLGLGLWEAGHLRHLPLGEGDADVHFGYAEGIGHPEAGLVAVRQRPGTWRVPLAHGQVNLWVPPGSRVVGVGVLAHKVEEPALVLLGGDGRTLTLAAHSESRTLVRSTEALSQVVVSHGMAALAWLTVKGEVVVWSLQHSAVLYRALPSEAS